MSRLVWMNGDEADALTRVLTMVETRVKEYEHKHDSEVRAYEDVMTRRERHIAEGGSMHDPGPWANLRRPVMNPNHGTLVADRARLRGLLARYEGDAEDD